MFHPRPVIFFASLAISAGIFLSLAMLASPVAACTSILVTRGASADGSVIITYNCDGPGIGGALVIRPSADHKPGEMFDLNGRGKIPQVPHTYRTVGLINEFQVSMGETTFGGRKELENPRGVLRYEMLMDLGLQRSRTAREAIQVMAKLVTEYGYGDGGESISIADPHEAWVLEIVGTGPGGRGGVWVAVRIPDGHISCHANLARIGEFPRNDPANCLYSENVESFAISRGYYDPKSGQPFRFDEAYCPRTPAKRRTCDARVWSVFRRAAPSQHFAPDYHRSKPGAQAYPYSIVPDTKLSVADVFALMRDHYEGTEYDMTQGADAGPFGSPYRARPVMWSLHGREHGWERPISVNMTACSSVLQSRAWLPNPVGGMLWYALDDAYNSCYLPFYCGINGTPKSFDIGASDKFSWASASWVFNFVANYATLKYCYMIRDIQALQKDIESTQFAIQPAFEKTAVELAQTNPELLTRYLTDYSVLHAEQTVDRWRALAESLIVKYNDGFVRDGQGRFNEVGYPEAWLQRVTNERLDHFRLPADAKK